MRATIHVRDLWDEAFEILAEEQDENAHYVSTADAESCEDYWESETAEYPDSNELEITIDSFDLNR